MKAIKRLWAIVLAVVCPKKLIKGDVISTITLLGPEKLHVEHLRPIDPNLPLREGMYVISDGRYWIYQNGEWKKYFELFGHLHNRSGVTSDISISD